MGKVAGACKSPRIIKVNGLYSEHLFTHIHTLMAMRGANCSSVWGVLGAIWGSVLRPRYRLQHCRLKDREANHLIGGRPALRPSHSCPFFNLSWGRWWLFCPRYNKNNRNVKSSERDPWHVETSRLCFGAWCLIDRFICLSQWQLPLDSRQNTQSRMLRF